MIIAVPFRYINDYFSYHKVLEDEVFLPKGNTIISLENVERQVRLIVQYLCWFFDLIKLERKVKIKLNFSKLSNESEII